MILVNVVKEGHTFSRLEIVKTPHQTTMDNKRIESLLIWFCETDITDSIDINVTAKLELWTRRNVLLAHLLSGLLVSYHDASFHKIMTSYPAH